MNRSAAIDESRQRLREASVDTTASYKRVAQPGSARKTASDSKVPVPIGDYAATKDEKMLINVYQGQQPEVQGSTTTTTHAHAGMGGFPVRRSHVYETPKAPGEGGSDTPVGTKVYYELDPNDPRHSARRST